MASEWIKHVLKVKNDKKISFKQALKEAKKTYHKKSSSMPHKKHSKKIKKSKRLKKSKKSKKSKRR